MSRYIADSFARDFKIDPTRVIPVGAGPNAEPAALLAIDRQPRRTSPASPPTILFIGREFVRKGGDVLLAAFERVKMAVPDARLLVVGPRDRMALPEGASFLGFLDRTAPDDWAILRAAFERASVFTLPAKHEPFGLVVLEAMYAGLPVVATRIGALQEMVSDGVTGCLVPPSDVHALAEALIAMLTEKRSVEMGLAGRARALESYSWSRVCSTIATRMEGDLAR
jgi:glycosyltransferase involved in cell wall biosynthesis